MKLVDWILELAAGAPPAAPQNATPLREAYGETIDDDDDKYRPLTGDTDKDLSPLQQTRMQKVAAWLWERNPLANRMIELVVAYLLGEGVRVSVRNENAQKVLRKFWRDPINALAIKLPAMVREGEIYGEQCYPVFVNELDGHVRLGYLDPVLIETIVMDPANRSQPIGVVTVKDKQGKARRYRVIVGQGGDDEELLFAERTREIRQTFTDGACFLLRQNHLLGGQRGRSSLLAGMDWLDGYDEFLWGELDRARDLRTVLWDVTIDGATEEDIKARAKNIAPPVERTVRVHNQLEKWEAKAAALGAGESETMSRLFRNHVLGGATIPEHWFGGGGDVNRNAASEMGEPTFKVLTQKQQQWKHFLELIARYVLAQAAAGGMLKGYDPENEDYEPEAVFPELTARDTTKYAAALQQVAAACIQLIDAGLLTEERALHVLASIAGRLGVEIDAAAELVKARAEAKTRRDERDERDAFGGDPDPDPEPAPAQGADNAAARAAAEE
jgi:hypothetical protein